MTTSAFLGTNPARELITSGLPVIRELVRSILTSVVVATVEDLNCGPLDQIFA